MNTFNADAVINLAPPVPEYEPQDVPKTAEIGDGERNSSLFRIAIELKDTGLDEQQTLTIIEAHNEARCTPPLEFDELKGIVTSAFRNGYSREQKRDYAIRNTLGIDVELLTSLKELKPLQYTQDEKGLARMFADLYKRKCRFNATENEWMVHNGQLWKTDIKGMQVAHLAKEFSDALIIYGTTIKNQSAKKHFNDFANKTTRAKVRETLIRDARDCHHITKTDLDKNPDLFNCQDCTYNLKTFTRQPHNPDDLISKISNVIVNEIKTCPRFVKFINEVMKGNKEKIRYLQKALGYALTAETLIEACFILYGPSTRNGKSTLVETISHKMRDYAMTIKPETLATKQNNDSRQANNDIARLDGCRFLNAAEPKKNMMFDAGLLKQFTGRDTITARYLYQGEFQFVPKFKLFMNTNFLPNIKEDTLFTSGRINVIVFDRRFEPHEQDPTLKDQLKEPDNISGIFNWCLEGLRMFRAEGLIPPQCVIDATAEYRAKSDKIGNFVEDRLEKSSENVKASEVYDAYQKWCTVNGYFPENKSNFYEALNGKKLLSATGTVNKVTERNVVKGYKVKIIPIKFSRSDV